jgi:type IV pilus assembly protein PilC
MQYTYVAVNPSGTRQKGLLEANNKKEVIDYLRENSLTPIVITETRTFKVPFADYFTKVKSSDILIFTRQLASMSQTGLTLIESLNLLKEQSTKPAMRALLLDLIASVSGGESFSLALSHHKDIFSEVYIALIKAAEKGGVMDKVLIRLADNLERSEDLKKKVKSALYYPSIVMIGIVVVIVIMNVFVIPQLSSLYEGLNVELPATTRFVLGFSRGFTVALPIIIILIIGLALLYKRFQKSDEGKEVIDKLKLKIPIMGGIIKLSVEDEISRTLSLLISSGTSILEGLSITSNVAGNFVYKQAVIKASNLVEKGIPLSTSFEQQNLFPPIFIQMAKVGESTGKIDENLSQAAGYFERDLDLRIRTLTSSIEPILIVVLGVSVGFLIISVISPIYGLISSIQ